MSENAILFVIFMLLSLYNLSISELPQMILILYLIEFMKRTIAYYRDVYYRKTNIIKFVFDLELLPWIFFAVMLVFNILELIHSSLFMNLNPIRRGNETTLVYYLTQILAAFYLLKTINYENSAYKRIKNMRNFNGLDYGSGMANSFLHGYLSIMLPDKGDSSKGIKEQITVYEDREGVKFPKKKLYILVNKHMYCPPNLQNLPGRRNGPTMEAAKNLDEVCRNRAGVVNRIYKNSVYKILRNDATAPVYVVAEGATPLQTLWNSLASNSEHRPFYDQHKEDIIQCFYDCLISLLNSNIEYKDVCEVVYFDSERDNVAEILLQRIFKQED